MKAVTDSVWDRNRSGPMGKQRKKNKYFRRDTAVLFLELTQLNNSNFLIHVLSFAITLQYFYFHFNLTRIHLIVYTFHNKVLFIHWFGV